MTHNPAKADELCRCYEQLRAQAIDPGKCSRGIGLNILLRQGMAAWLAIVTRELSTPEQCAHADTKKENLPSREWVQILAGLVLGDGQAREVCNV